MLFDADGLPMDMHDPFDDLDRLDNDGGDIPAEMELDHHIEPLSEFLKD